MKPKVFTPPGKTVAREQVPPYREILFNPETRRFHWEDAVLSCDSFLDERGDLVMHLRYESLSPEDIAAHIDDDTMAKCMAMAINPAR